MLSKFSDPCTELRPTSTSVNIILFPITVSETSLSSDPVLGTLLWDHGPHFQGSVTWWSRL